MKLSLIIIGLLWLGLYGVARRGQARLTRLGGAFVAETVAAAGGLALATVGFFWQILLTDSAWMPAGGGDLAPFLYPNYYFAAAHLRQGTLPLWNPHLYGGVPFAADIQTGLFYPFNWFIFLLVPEVSFKWLQGLAVFHFWLAGLLMYLCLRLLHLPHRKAKANTFQISPPGPPKGGEKSEIPPAGGLGGLATEHIYKRTSYLKGIETRAALSTQSPVSLSPLAAFFGALAFEFSDLFIVHFGNLNMIAVAAWLPLIFLLYHHALRRASPGLAAAAGAVLAIATLAGHIQITLFILLLLGLYTLWQTTLTHYALRTMYDTVSDFVTPMARRFSLLLITLLITIGLSALLLFPAYEMSQYTPRAQLPYPEAAQYSLHPVQLVGLLVPNYFGRDPALHWGPWERVETGYIGIITLLLAGVGGLLWPGRSKGFFIGLALVALLLALGGSSVLHGWLYATAPGFGQLRAPARFILLLDFALAWLAAFGLEQLLHPLSSQAKQRLTALLRPLTWGLGGLIVVAVPLSYYALLVTQDRNPVIFERAGGAATGVMTFALLAIAGVLFLYLINNNWLREKYVGITAILILMLDLFTLGAKVDVGHTDPTGGFDHPAAIAFLQNDPGLFRTEVTTDVWHLWQPNTGLLHGWDDVWGLYNPLTLADPTLYWSGAPPRSSGRYNFLGVKYIIAGKGGAPADGNIVPVFNDDPGINIYLNQDALARVLFVGQASVVPDHDAAWQAIRATDFDPAGTVILEGGRPLTTHPTSRLAISQYDLHLVTLTVETDQPGYLVLADAFYPGWRATIDGQPTPIERANYAFRAVYVPAGSHTVQFLFDPLIWKMGLVVSGLTLLGLLGWWGWSVSRGR